MKIEEISKMSLLLYTTRVGTREQLVECARGMLKTGGAIFTVNPTILTQAIDCDELYRALGRGVCIPDGVGVKYALSGLGTPSDTVPGVELAEELLTGGVKFAIVGGKAGRAELAAKNLLERHAGCECVLTMDGYSHSKEDIRESLLKCGADVVFVCLGSPRQEVFISELTEAGGRALYIALGGSVDIYSGKLKRAPRVFRALSLEWAWRIIRQPRRIGGVAKLIRFAHLSGAICHILRKSGRDVTQII